MESQSVLQAGTQAIFLLKWVPQLKRPQSSTVENLEAEGSSSPSWVTPKSSTVEDLEAEGSSSASLVTPVPFRTL